MDWRIYLFYKLPDRNTITSALDVEVLFQRSVTGKEASGIHDTSFQISRKCDFATRKELYTTVVSSGGNDHVQGFCGGAHDEGTDGVGSIHNEIKATTPIRYGLEVCLVFPQHTPVVSFFLDCIDLPLSLGFFIF